MFGDLNNGSEPAPANVQVIRSHLGRGNRPRPRGVPEGLCEGGGNGKEPGRAAQASQNGRALRESACPAVVPSGTSFSLWCAGACPAGWRQAFRYRLAGGSRADPARAHFDRNAPTNLRQILRQRSSDQESPRPAIHLPVLTYISPLVDQCVSQPA